MLGVIARFLQVGAVAFTIDAGLLWLFVYGFNWPPIVSRLGSFLVTIAVTFILNARYTFEVSTAGASKSRYVIIQCFGSAVNFAAYSGLVLLAWLGPLWALVVGSALGSSLNFVLMRSFVFSGASDKPPASDQSKN